MAQMEEEKKPTLDRWCNGEGNVLRFTRVRDSLRLRRQRYKPDRIMLEFNIGVSALQAAQRAMEVTGNNVANANTPGYHRQVVKLAAQSPMELNGQSFGRGVEVVDVRRVINLQIEAAITNQATENGYVDSSRLSLSHLQASIPTDEMSIANQLGAVLNGMQQVSAQVGNIAARRGVVTDAMSLAQRFNSLASTMDQMRTSLDANIRAAVNSINPLLKQIGELNAQIANFVDQGVSPNDLIDKRDELVNTIARQMPVDVQEGDIGQVTLLQSGAPLVIGSNYQQLQCGLNADGQMAITANGVIPLTVDSGELGAMLEFRNRQLPDYRNRLESLAQEVTRQFDALQSTGLGIAGGFTKLIGQRAATNVDVPLSAAGLSFPPKAGSLYVGVTNIATGQRTMVEVQIDPATQTLTDVAAAINTAAPEVQAFVSTQAGTLSLFASTGYKFEFAGGIDAVPTTSFSAGTTVTATTGGAVTGSTNDEYTFTFLASGTVGVTPGLQARVTDKNGNVIGTVDIGQGYEAGQPVATANGVTLTLSAGNVVAGDSLSTRVIGQPDTAGILTALGLNTFFTGTDATSMKVNDLLTSNPDLLATSRTGLPGDTTNLQRFVALQDQPLMADGTQTLTDYFHQIVADVGTQVSRLDQQSTTNQVLTTRLQEQQQSLSGVDVNEEMIQVIKYQQMFQSAAKYISAVNDMYQQLFQSL